MNILPCTAFPIASSVSCFSQRRFQQTKSVPEVKEKFPTNAEIPYDSFILILKDGTRHGEIKKSDALKLLNEKEELVLVNVATPLSFVRLRAVIEEIPKEDVIKPKDRKKEMQFTAAISENDLMVKIQKIRKFLEKNLNVSVEIRVNKASQAQLPVVYQTILKELAEFGAQYGKSQILGKKMLFEIRPNKTK